MTKYTSSCKGQSSYITLTFNFLIVIILSNCILLSVRSVILDLFNCNERLYKKNISVADLHSKILDAPRFNILHFHAVCRRNLAK